MTLLKYNLKGGGVRPEELPPGQEPSSSWGLEELKGGFSALRFCIFFTSILFLSISSMFASSLKRETTHGSLTCLGPKPHLSLDCSSRSQSQSLGGAFPSGTATLLLSSPSPPSWISSARLSGLPAPVPQPAPASLPGERVLPLAAPGLGHNVTHTGFEDTQKEGV